MKGRGKRAEIVRRRLTHRQLYATFKSMEWKSLVDLVPYNSKDKVVDNTEKLLDLNRRER